MWTENAWVGSVVERLDQPRSRKSLPSRISPGKLRELLQGDVGVAAQVLKALVGDVVIEKQRIEGHEKPQMVARFTINAVPVIAVLDRGGPTDRNAAPVLVWDSIHSSPGAEPAPAAGPAEAIVPLIYDRRAAARKASVTRDIKSTQ